MVRTNKAEIKQHHYLYLDTETCSLIINGYDNRNTHFAILGLGTAILDYT